MAGSIDCDCGKVNVFPTLELAEQAVNHYNRDRCTPNGVRQYPVRCTRCGQYCLTSHKYGEWRPGVAVEEMVEAEV